VVPWIPFTRANANAQWVIHGSSSTLIYTSELILCFTICVLSATRHNIHMYPDYLKDYLRNKMGCKKARLHSVFKKIRKTSFKIRGKVCSRSSPDVVYKITGCFCESTVELKLPFFSLFWGRYQSHTCNLRYRVNYLQVVFRLQYFAVCNWFQVQARSLSEKVSVRFGYVAEMN